MLTHLQKVKRLYKTILKLHKALPYELRVLGDNYAKDEFKRHKMCTTQQSEIFMREWSVYVLTLAEQVGLRGPHTSQPLGISLTESELNDFQNEQLQQLYELMLAAKSKKTNEQ